MAIHGRLRPASEVVPHLIGMSIGYEVPYNRLCELEVGAICFLEDMVVGNIAIRPLKEFLEYFIELKKQISDIPMY